MIIYYILVRLTSLRYCLNASSTIDDWMDILNFLLTSMHYYYIYVHNSRIVFHLFNCRSSVYRAIIIRNESIKRKEEKKKKWRSKLSFQEEAEKSVRKWRNYENFITIGEGMEDYYSRLKLRTLVGRSEILYFVRFFCGEGRGDFLIFFCTNHTYLHG